MKSLKLEINSPKHTQTGVTLLLALLVLSGITAVAFSLATVMFIEVRNSSDLQRSEPGLFVTQGILEEAIFKYKREVSDSSITTTGCPGSAPVSLGCGFNSVTVSTNVDATGPISITETVLPTSDDFATTPNVYYMIDALNPYVGLGDGSPDGGYGRVTVTNVGQSTHADLRVALCRLDEDDCVATGIWDQFQFLPVGSIPVSWTLDDLSSYQLVVINLTGGTVSGFIKIDTFGPASAYTAKGLPYFGKRAVEVTASYLGLTRKYRALVPTQ